MVALMVVVVGATTTACAAKLDGSSTCTVFMNSSEQEQYDVVSSLASKYQKPDYATPLGRPNIPYYCAAKPNMTLDQLFAGL